MLACRLIFSLNFFSTVLLMNIIFHMEVNLENSNLYDGPPFT